MKCDSQTGQTDHLRTWLTWWAPITTTVDLRCGGKPDERMRASGAVYIMARTMFGSTRPIMEMQSVLVTAQCTMQWGCWFVPGCPERAARLY